MNTLLTSPDPANPLTDKLLKKSTKNEDFLVREYKRLGAGKAVNVDVFDFVKVKYSIIWESESAATLTIEEVKGFPSVNGKFNNFTDVVMASSFRFIDFNWEYFLIYDARFNKEYVAFNKSIKDFIAVAEAYGQLNYGSKDWFFEKYVWGLNKVG